MNDCDRLIEKQKRHKDNLYDVGADRPETSTTFPTMSIHGGMAKIELFGNEMIEKQVKACANSGRVYLPPEWIGRRVKIIRID